MFCSTVIPTINRPTLSRAVSSVLNQVFSAEDFEVIVVNDSGHPLPDMDWTRSRRVRVLDTNRRERSVARNTGAAVARGRYLHFLDDDDMLLPGALEAIWELDQSCDAGWLYGGYRSVDNDGNLVREYHPEVSGNIFALLVAGEAIPFGASWLDGEQFFAAGAFDPRFAGTEDRDLGRRIALRGTVARTFVTVTNLRVGQQGSTTDWTRLPEKDRWGREKALNQPGAFERLRVSANSSYLRGRVSRACLASMLWNLRHSHRFIAVSRAISALAFAGHYAFAVDFWRGMRTKIK